MGHRRHGPFTSSVDARPRRRAPALEPALLVVEGALAIASAYLLGLLAAARGWRGREAGRDASPGAPCTGRIGGSDERMRIAVLVPAHNEQAGIDATLASLAALDYPRDRFQTIVIADNCDDATALRAREAGAEAWERVAPGERGKGHALAWAIDMLTAGVDEFDAVVIVDADCTVSSNLLSATDATLRRGASAAQVACEVANAPASHASALRYAAFALMNTVRPLGKRRLGLSCGLFGTGVALTTELLARVPWSAHGLAEDGEYHLRLVDAGERVEFVPEAWVRSAMPTSLRRGAEQQARWEQGKLQLIRRFGPRLLASGLARRDLVRVHAGLEHLVPPQSLIAAASIVSAATGDALGSRRLSRLARATLTAQLVYVLGGLRLVRAPSCAYRALALAPLLMAGKAMLYVRLLGRRGPEQWMRTERDTPPEETLPPR